MRGNTLFVANFDGDTVGKYDAKTGATINPSFITGLSALGELALSGNTLFVASAGRVGAYDATTGAAINPSFITGLAGAVGLAVKSATVRFAAFSAKLKSFSTTFQLTRAFTLGPDSNGIDPVKENVTLRIGTFSFKIPPGSFNREQDGRFFFTGTVDQGIFQAQIVPLGNNMFTYSFTGAGLDLTPFSKVKVGLTIGIDTGTTRVRVSLW